MPEGTDRADILRDRIAIDRITLDHPSLPVPFTSPDMARFLFTGHKPDMARASVVMARLVFASAFGVTFTWRDVWTEDGARREYRAGLSSGLQVVLVARAAHMPQDEDGAEVRELEDVAA